ncbi:Polyphosphoinositide phosphatase [Zostera marina]|uniref:Polyphosphoinositide phosphatase n=1 Tax=Zostera marina TaxID=29655 RepID=A0A0K9NKD2_ZOSMR|nr:Polyphosphoinositide phosphatase [Zostera marina]
MVTDCRPMNSIKRKLDEWTDSHREIYVYKTRSKFYMMRSDDRRRFWKVLTIDRLNPLKLTMYDHSITYSSSQRIVLLDKINLRNASSGGLKFITLCHGIVGFVQFSGPYYMVLITEKAQIGSIINHKIYTITKTEMIPLSNSTYGSNLSNSKNENRFKELFCKMDLTKDFFFSYTYCIMHTIQKNLCNSNKMEDSYDSMFVWNEFMTRGIRRQLNNTLWTVALVYGFFKQTSLSTYIKDFTLTLISRRSRHFAGTRYLKRGINKEGKVANEVETEQIVLHDLSHYLTEVTSVVQHRGSIPIFWSQETSLLNVKPDIIVSKNQNNLEATRLHFEDLFNRYGDSIIILNLIKTREKEPRESIIHKEFVNAVNAIVPNLPKRNCLQFLHKDLNELSKREGTNVLKILGRVGNYALSRTGFFYGQVTADLDLQNFEEGLCSYEDNDAIEKTYANYKSDAETKISENTYEETVNGFQSTSYLGKSPKLQNGVLRTNCIDCLDRTNVAQFVYGLASLQHQLYTLHLIYSPRVDLDEPLANDLMTLYEEMGDILAMQYGGSGAHNKVYFLSIIFGYLLNSLLSSVIL